MTAFKKPKINRQSHRIVRGAAFDAAKEEAKGKAKIQVPEASPELTIYVYHKNGSVIRAVDSEGRDRTSEYQPSPDPARFEERYQFSKAGGRGDSELKPVPFTDGSGSGVVSKDSPLLKGLPAKSGWDGAF